MMKLTQVKKNLCIRDKRNPDFNDMYGCYSEEEFPPRENCSCDNCFYGRDKLAVEIIELRTKEVMDNVKITRSKRGD